MRPAKSFQPPLEFEVKQDWREKIPLAGMLVYNNNIKFASTRGYVGYGGELARRIEADNDNDLPLSRNDSDYLAIQMFGSVAALTPIFGAIHYFFG